MSAKTIYNYPDDGDKTTQTGVDTQEPYAGYWRKSEEYVLRFVDDMLSTRKFDALIDIGCGKGRLTTRYARHFDRTIALDPDQSRLETAETRFRDQHLPGVVCIPEKFLDVSFTDGSLDVAICSHVIQHIPSYDVPPFIAKVWRILKKEGVLVLLTTHSRKRQNVYLGSYLENGRCVEPVISETQFNYLCEHPTNVLPSTLFSLRNIRKCLHGFRISTMKVFHALHRPNLLDRIVFRDRVINFPLIRRYCGEDVFVLGVKRPERE